MDMELYLLVLLLLIKIRKNKYRRKRRYGVRPINQSRDKMFFKIIFLKMKKDDPEQFFKYTRMSADTFDFLLPLLKIQLVRKSKKAITPETKLAVTLIYLSQGDSVQSVAWCYHLGKTTVRQIVLQTCVSIYKVLKGAFLPPPSTDEWKKFQMLLILNGIFQIASEPLMANILPSVYHQTPDHNITTTKNSIASYCWQFAMPIITLLW